MAIEADPPRLPAGIDIRKLARTDARAWRALRLQALQTHPTAYAESFEEASQRNLAWFRKGVMWGIYVEPALRTRYR